MSSKSTFTLFTSILIILSLMDLGIGKVVDITGSQDARQRTNAESLRGLFSAWEKIDEDNDAGIKKANVAIIHEHSHMSVYGIPSFDRTTRFIRSTFSLVKANRRKVIYLGMCNSESNQDKTNLGVSLTNILYNDCNEDSTVFLIYQQPGSSHISGGSGLVNMDTLAYSADGSSQMHKFILGYKDRDLKSGSMWSKVKEAIDETNNAIHGDLVGSTASLKLICKTPKPTNELYHNSFWVNANANGPVSNNMRLVFRLDTHDMLALFHNAVSLRLKFKNKIIKREAVKNGGIVQGNNKYAELRRLITRAKKFLMDLNLPHMDKFMTIFRTNKEVNDEDTYKEKFNQILNLILENYQTNDLY